MEMEQLRPRKPVFVRSETAPEEGHTPMVREKLSDLKDASDMLRKQTDVARRAMEYAEANEGDLEED
jgi:hypothetical protein